ncbi:unnamed protein product [Pieris macdunnoughi]|uniref:C2H2-type domain-containing protein n=1 Tax=Pieris macdunnoughi TaxID=345717 RepID=A0A821X7A5_9NEOP|nr:unnamed protein product [Pieris macdunnoughi]
MARFLVVRTRRPPRHPADDLRAIAGSPSPQPRNSPSPPPSPGSPEDADVDGPYKCEMCSLEFPRRDALLLHVPIHI